MKLANEIAEAILDGLGWGGGSSSGTWRDEMIPIIAAKLEPVREALQLIWDWCEDEEVKGCLMNAAIHHTPGSDRTRKMYTDAKAAREAALALLSKGNDGKGGDD